MDMNTRMCHADLLRLAESIKQTCIRTALEGYELAAMQGLCHEGAWEAGISAMQMIDIDALIKEDAGARTSKR